MVVAENDVLLLDIIAVELFVFKPVDNWWVGDNEFDGVRVKGEGVEGYGFILKLLE